MPAIQGAGLLSLRAIKACIVPRRRSADGRTRSRKFGGVNSERWKAYESYSIASNAVARPLGLERAAAEDLRATLDPDVTREA